MPIKFETGSLIVFKDLQSDSNFYAMTPEVLEEKIRIVRMHGTNYEREVPDNITIKVCPIIFSGKTDKHGNKLYVAQEKTLIDFPINRIEWIFIRMVYNE